jgi:hypothetical protein
MAAFAKSRYNRPAPALGVAAGALSERSWRGVLSIFAHESLFIF